FDGAGGAREAERFDMGNRIREVEEGPGGSLWLLEDAPEGGQGRLLKLVPAGAGIRAGRCRIRSRRRHRGGGGLGHRRPAADPRIRNATPPCWWRCAPAPCSPGTQLT